MTSKKEDVKIILVMGKSGSGKQPRIDCLAEEFGFMQVSTGNLFRACIGLFNSVDFKGELKSAWDDSKNDFKPDTDLLKIVEEHAANKDVLSSAATNKETLILGMKAKYFVEAGLFCPDSITNGIFANAFETYFSAPLETCGSKRRGLILDGFPRTLPQGQFLDDLLKKHNLKIDFILEVDLDDDTIIKRTTDRRICPKCQAVFHLMFKPPRDEKFCTECGTEVKQRADDASEALLRNRLKEYTDKVAPTLAKYKADGIPVATVTGNLPDMKPETIRNSVMGAVDKLF
ncbi:putative Adenylate kinase [Blattamonas nauphoetae]|uniref:Adenylate kinase n=1 Tax=Blattamonas nauphoetae TaxID=2049346 RepID=A0ABQ9WX62_9EUKA|nr:putative Adenylate kinase [Blattamonas nauphoetae]